jgi:putative nucleotidyltransferase with HDIG domain
MNRDDAMALVNEYTENQNLVKHMLCVEAAMRWYARKYGEDEELWGAVGLVHDFDYERWPNNEQHPTEGHPTTGVNILREKGWSDEACNAVLSHGTYTGQPRDTLMAKTLYACDELTGLVVATALVRPSKKLAEVNVKSVKKKWKDKGFAKGVNRQDIAEGAEDLGVPIDEHIANVIEAMQAASDELGL